jgi:hypothetical protein
MGDGLKAGAGLWEITMKPKQPKGNGSGKFDITQLDMGGWVRIFASPLAGVPDDLGVALSQALIDWFRQRGQYHLRAVAPVVRNGDTVELHGYYERVVFPSLASQ